MKQFRQVYENNTVRQLALTSVFVIALIVGIYYAKSILFPICFGFIFANLLYPLVRLLNKKWRVNDSIAVTFSVLTALSLVVLLIYVLGEQVGNVFNDLPKITKNLNENLENVQHFITQKLHISAKKQSNLLENTVQQTSLINSNTLTSFFTFTELLTNIVLTPIYTFFILIYRKNFVAFAVGLSKPNHKRSTHFLLEKINEVMIQYVSGLLLEMVCVATLIGLGYWIIGIKYALFLAILTAILNLIPYVGIFISCAISILMTIVGSTDLTLIGSVLALNIIVQVIDSNILIPKIIGSKISINAMASMLGVIVGGAIAGVGGMFLSLPILAVLNVIFQHSEKLKPYSYLVGQMKK